MMLQWKSRVYSWGSGVTLGWTAVLFNVFFSRPSCKKLPTWWVLYSIRGESCIMSVTGLVIHSPQTFRVFFRGPRSLISCSLFLILTLRWGRRTWSEHLALPCFPPCPQGRHRLMSPIVLHLYFSLPQASMAAERDAMLGFKLPWSSPSPKQIFNLWKLISWPPWSVAPWCRSGWGVVDGEQRTQKQPEAGWLK